MFKPSACWSINSLENVIWGPVEFGIWWRGVDYCVGKPPPVFFISFFAVGCKQRRSNFTGLLCANILPQQRYENTNSHFLLFFFPQSIFPMTYWTTGLRWFFLSVKFDWFWLFAQLPVTSVITFLSLPVSFVVLCCSRVAHHNPR